MSRLMRGGALARNKKKTTKIQKGATKQVATKKVATKKIARARRDDDEDDADDRGRGAPPPKKDNTSVIIAIVVGVILVGLVAIMAGGGGSNMVDEHEAEKAYNYVDGQYAVAKGGDALAENRAALRAAFQKVVDAYPATESAEKARKRIRELQ